MYVDDAHFTKLFRRRKANHAAIIIELDRIARNMVRLYRWPSPHDAEDAASSALVRAIERMPAFNTARGSGFAFFSRVVETGLLNELERLANRRKRRETPLHDGM